MVYFGWYVYVVVTGDGESCVSNVASQCTAFEFRGTRPTPKRRQKKCPPDSKRAHCNIAVEANRLAGKRASLLITRHVAAAAASDTLLFAFQINDRVFRGIFPIFLLVVAFVAAALATVWRKKMIVEVII